LARPDIATLSVGYLHEETNIPIVEPFIPLTSDDDVEHFGDTPVFDALGISSVPFPPTDEGRAEGYIQRDVGGFDGVVVGARDVRCASVLAAMKPGDVVLHACSPDAKAQVRCLATRQVVLATEDPNGDTAVLMLDGATGKFQVAIKGGLLEISDDNGACLVAPDGGAITIKAGDFVTTCDKTTVQSLVARGECNFGDTNAMATDYVMLSADLLTWIDEVNTLLVPRHREVDWIVMPPAASAKARALGMSVRACAERRRHQTSI
jgi:hypothetical protein